MSHELERNLTFDEKKSSKKFKRRMTLKRFVVFFAIAMVGTAISNILKALNIISSYIPDGMSSSNMGEFDFWEFCISIEIGPIFEELLFRGTLLAFTKVFKRNRWIITFGIILSSVLFGYAHGNWRQGISAGISGIVYGYVAIYYDLVYAILLHMLNNASVYLIAYGGVPVIEMTWGILLIIAIEQMPKLTEKLRYKFKKEE